MQVFICSSNIYGLAGELYCCLQGPQQATLCRLGVALACSIVQGGESVVDVPP
jgi:hypothetical protein